MNKVTVLKWGVKIGDQLYPAGTEVRLATLGEARTIFPAIRANPDSTQVAVWFPDLKHPTIVHVKQICQKV